jgi:putative pyruvate formate lyase activating enzyme
MALVSSFNPHFGEEAPLVGAFGSGTIFFTHCNLHCDFCQNYDISHEGAGEEVSIGQLAGTMLILQNSGCHNINLVTPSHVVPQILSAVDMAIDGGLKIPLVYNSSGYDSVETLMLLEGVVDIYLVDFKFWQPRVAGVTCDAPDYPDVTRRAILEMYRQVGDLTMDENGIATRGLMVRHLLLPDGLAGTAEVMRFISNEVSKETYVNIMNQYRPRGEVSRVKEMSRPTAAGAYEKAIEIAKNAGLHRLER